MVPVENHYRVLFEMAYRQARINERKGALGEATVDIWEMLHEAAPNCYSYDEAWTLANDIMYAAMEALSNGYEINPWWALHEKLRGAAYLKCAQDAELKKFVSDSDIPF